MKYKATPADMTRLHDLAATLGLDVTALAEMLGVDLSGTAAFKAAPPADGWTVAYKGETMKDFLDGVDGWTDALESLHEIDAEAAARVLQAATDALEAEVGAVSAATKAMRDPAFQAEVMRLIELKSRGRHGQFAATVAALGF